VASNRRIRCKCREVELNNPGGAKSFLWSDNQSRGQTIAYLFSHPEARYPIGKCLVLALTDGLIKADSHIACRAHALPLPCRAAEGLKCVFPI
jgi:hypothetical protein